MKLIPKILLSLGLLFILNNSLLVHAQCAMCKSTVESNQKEQIEKAVKKAKGLNTGILYMMVIPYIMFATIGVMWYRNSKKERNERIKINSIINSATS